LWPVSYWHSFHLRFGREMTWYVSFGCGNIEAGGYRGWWGWSPWVERTWWDCSIEPSNCYTHMYMFNLPVNWLEFGIACSHYQDLGLTSGWPTFKAHAGWAGLRVRSSFLYPVLIAAFGVWAKGRKRRIPGAFPIAPSEPVNTIPPSPSATPDSGSPRR
jgi:hypothetical protein